MEERLELLARALEDTAESWEALGRLLSESQGQVAQVQVAGTDAWAAELAGFWEDVRAEVEAARLLVVGWAEGLRAVVADVSGVEAEVVADLAALVRGERR